jgi:hypothetical protein
LAFYVALGVILVKGELVDGSVFPGGRWLDATTGNYTDATVTDGDADWSFER